jgi:ankyrin repeat protein
MWAAMEGHTEVVKALIEGRADMNATEQVRHRHFFSALFQYRRRNE